MPCHVPFQHACWHSPPLATLPLPFLTLSLSLSLLPFLSPPRSPFLLTLFFYCIINLIFLCNVCITVRFYCPCQCPLPLPPHPLSQSCEKSITCTQVLRVLALSSRLLMLALWLVLRFTILANFCFLEVSPPRAKGIIFYPAPLFLSPSFCTSSTSSLCFSVRKSGSSGMGGVGHSVELGKFLLSLLECFAFWFFRLPQTCSKPKKGFFRRQFCLFHSLTIFPSVSHMKSCSEILNFSTYRV